MRVLLCDDHRSFGDSLASYLDRCGVEVVGPVESVIGLDPAAWAEPIDVVLTDLHFPDVGVADVLPTLRRVLPDVPVVLLTAELDRQQLQVAVDAGADGVVLKTDALAEIERVVRRVGAPADAAATATRRPVCSRNAQGRLERGSGAGRGADLTGRERDVLRLLARGESTADVATELGIGAATVRTHVQNLMVKFGVHSRLELVASAMRAGTIEVGS